MDDHVMTIDGVPVVGEAPPVAVVDPATEQVLAHAPGCSPGQLDEAMGSAERALRGWRRDDGQRRAALRAMAGALEDAVDEVALLLTREQGKPLVDARREVMTAAVWLRYFADLERPREIVQDDERRFVEIQRAPIGVVGAITPWNFPLALAMWKVGPALRAGNTVVLKPSPFTPLSTLLCGRIFAGHLPPGVLNVVSGADALGPLITAHPVPRKISFTGSTATGKRVAVSAGADLKRVTLELGGNDPAILLPDADVAALADTLFWNAFANNGQVCLAVKRVYVHESVHDDLVDALAAVASAVRVGPGTGDGVRLGPVNNAPQYARVSELVGDALRNGGRAVTGGRETDGPGYFYPPTILDGVTAGHRIVEEEQFGPALPIIRYRDVADAVRQANSGMYGLTASVWAQDVDRAAEVATDLDCGQVSINVHGGAVLPNLPFGGHKWSGIGVENGIWGLDGFTEMRVVSRPPRPRADG